MDIQPWFDTCPSHHRKSMWEVCARHNSSYPTWLHCLKMNAVHHSFLEAALQLEESWREELRSWPGHSLLTYLLLPTTTMLSSSCSRFPVGRIFPEYIASTTSRVSPAIQRSFTKSTPISLKTTLLVLTPWNAGILRATLYWKVGGRSGRVDWKYRHDT